MFEVDFLDNELASPKMQILLAEDDSSIRRFIEVILKRANYDVLTAECGLSAMKIALSNKIDAVVADAMMPNLGGFDLCRLMRQNPLMKNIPFVILSGLEQDPDLVAEFQADAYLVKGNDIKQRLTEKLSQLLLQPATV